MTEQVGRMINAKQVAEVLMNTWDSAPEHQAVRGTVGCRSV